MHAPREKGKGNMAFGLYEWDKVCKMEWSLQQKAYAKTARAAPGAGRKEHYGNQNNFQ